MKINILATYVLFLFLFSFCKKEDEHDDDHDHDTATNITLNWAQPAEGSTVKKGDTLRIEGTATHTSEMHGYEVVISKASDTTVAIHTGDGHVHGTTIVISEKWKNDLPDTTKLMVKLTVAKSHSGTDIEVFRRMVWAVK